MDAVVQILSVSVRNTRTGKQVYDVACSDSKKRQIWDAGLATAINAYTGTGQPVTIRYDVKQNGQYVNESIQAFAPPGQQLPPDGNMQAAQMGQPQPQPGFTPNAAPIGPAAPSDNFPPEVTARITKLASYDHAATLVGALLTGAGPEALSDALPLLDAVAKHIYGAVRSHEGQANPAQGPIIPTATTPQEVAAQLPAGAVQVGAPVIAAQQDAAAEAPQAEPSDVIKWD